MTDRARVSPALLPTARAVWLLIAATAAAIWVLGIPLYYRDALHIHNTDGFVDRHPAVWMHGLHQLGLSPRVFALVEVGHQTLLAWPMFLIGIVIFVRKSDEWIGYFTSLILVTFGTTATNSATVGLQNAYPDWSTFFNVVDSAAFGAFWILPLVFPDGRFVPRWSIASAAVLMFSAIGSGFPGSPVDINAWPSALSVPLISLAIVTVIGAPIYRYRRRSTAEERQQTKWATFGILSAVMAFAAALLVGGSSLLSGSASQLVLKDFLTSLVVALGFTAVPVCFAIAILRSRLWEIDVLINRTIVYGPLTITLAALYIGGVVAVQALLQLVTGGGSDLAVAVVTLIVAALFSPWRRRIQTFIDRRFYRRRYDAARTLAVFQTGLRDEVDLDRLREHLVDVIGETIQPASVTLWLPDRQEGV